MTVFEYGILFVIGSTVVGALIYGSIKIIEVIQKW